MKDHKVIVEFLQERTGYKGIKLDSLLEADLGVTGDDAIELMDAFFEKFNVEKSGFESWRHIQPETKASLLFSFVDIFRRSNFNKIKDISVEDLYRAYISKKWVEV